MTEARLLIVDDDAEMRQMLREYFDGAGYTSVLAESAAAALLAVERATFDAVVTDLRMEGMDGLDLTRALMSAAPGVPILMMTAFGSIETAIEAMKAGATNFITKPFKMAALKVLVDRAIEDRSLRDENRRLKREVGERFGLASLVGKSRPMQELYDLIERVAEASSNVIVTGESGTGKELVARALHYTGPRASMPFVPINCTSLPESLLESELFGHVRGSFTGAVATKRGLIEMAEGGSLFLDEIGDLDAGLQAKLLRVLEEREIRPVGSVTSRKVDVRVIAATHRDLARAVDAGEFREDLYFRLNVIAIRVPPLRERPEDIPLLVRHFLEQGANAPGRSAREISPAALAQLVERRFRGNVRELENVIERAAVLARGEVIEPADLAAPEEVGLSPAGLEGFLRGRPTLGELEERYIDLVLGEAGGDKANAARILGVSTRTLYRREKR